jgi:adenylate kinase
MKSAIGLQAEAVMARGELVSDEILFQILREELGPDSKERILLDGYPRNVAQAKTLDSLREIHPVVAAIHLDVEAVELINRLSGRRVCGNCGATFHVTMTPPIRAGVCDKCGGALQQRTDDREESVRTRLSVYESTTKPVLEYYREKGLYQRVDGQGSTEEVFGKLKGSLGGLKIR